MTSQAQRVWYNSARQQVLLEYAALRQSCPPGVYVTIRPGDPLHWSGVLFVRTGIVHAESYGSTLKLTSYPGPYSPAILRFQISFPIDYPGSAPTIIFKTDVFHPLITPLTTYTYSTGSTGTDTVSAGDQERLPPGSFSLRHGFPDWFARQGSGDSSERVKKEDTKSISHSSISATPVTDEAARESLGGDKATDVGSKPTNWRPGPIVRHNDTTILQVFEYLRRSFAEAEFLDAVPLEAAGNAGAWRAWRAHRVAEGSYFEDNTQAAKVTDHGTEWNWDGVWDQRVRKGIDLSVSDSVLFGTAAGDDTPRFHDLDEEMLRQIRSQVCDS